MEITQFVAHFNNVPNSKPLFHDSSKSVSKFGAMKRLSVNDAFLQLSINKDIQYAIGLLPHEKETLSRLLITALPICFNWV